MQAGYLALLASVSAEEAKTVQDQPSTAVVDLAASRLDLALSDRAFAKHGMQTYYSPQPLEFGTVKAWDIAMAQAIGNDCKRDRL